MPSMQPGPSTPSVGPSSHPLSLAEYKRYGRQMILPDFGLKGQTKLRAARVLVVGAGGLGCPAVQYLSAAGVGHISIVDHDNVETSNLARQILHTDAKVGMNKAVSAAAAAQVINPHICVEAVEDLFSVQNAAALVAAHDVVLDCTDNVLTRYLISDAAVKSGVEVVSGAAQGLEGQLVVLHKDLSVAASASGRSRQPARGTGKQRGPCYRCLFPKAPSPESVTDCEDGGVLGSVTGLVGTMQALEAVKLLTGLSSEEEPPHLTLVTPFNYPPFRTIKLRPQREATCRACGDPDLMTDEVRRSRIQPDLSNEDYVAFCGLNRLAADGSDLEQVDVSHFAQTSKERALVVDVRPQVEYEIAHLQPSTNMPFRGLQSKPQAAFDSIAMLAEPLTCKGAEQVLVYLVCRKGNDSLLAQRALMQAEPSSRTALHFINVTGGLRAWSAHVDDTFPVY